MTPPIVPEEPPAILRDNGLKAILNACAGTDFDARRDTAIVRPFDYPAIVDEV